MTYRPEGGRTYDPAQLHRELTGIARAVPYSINDLEDVTLTDPGNGDQLIFIDGEWVNIDLQPRALAWSQGNGNALVNGDILDGWTEQYELLLDADPATGVLTLGDTDHGVYQMNLLIQHTAASKTAYSWGIYVGGVLATEVDVVSGNNQDSVLFSWPYAPYFQVSETVDIRKVSGPGVTIEGATLTWGRTVRTS